MGFKVDQKVVCVDASDGPGDAYFHGLRKGETYVIESLDGAACVSVAGIRGCWLAARFRPVVERKTDIGFAHEILQKASKPKRVTACA